MIYNFGQAIDIVRQNLGFQTLDATTTPTLDLVKIYYNDSCREAMNFNFNFLQTWCQFPFTHTVDTYGAYFVGTATVSGNTFPISGLNIPYPNDYISCANLGNYSGLSMVGYSGVGFTGPLYSGISVSGQAIQSTETIQGRTYELPAAVDQIYDITIPYLSRSIKFKPMYELQNTYPIGIWTVSGTPIFYSNIPGIGPNGGQTVRFFPEPDQTTAGKLFVVHYKKKHVDLVADSDTQNIIPETYQNILIDATLEKCYNNMGDPKAQLHQAKKEEMLQKLKIWSENNLNYQYSFMDSASMQGGDGFNAYNSNVLFRL